MENVDTVVAAIDLEAGSDAVLARAAQLAGMHGAWLVVLHVIDAEPLQMLAAAACDVLVASGPARPDARVTGPA